MSVYDVAVAAAGAVVAAAAAAAAAIAIDCIIAYGVYLTML